MALTTHVLLCIVLVVPFALSMEKKCDSNFGYILDEECKTLYRCVWGVPVRMPDCKPGLIYSRSYHVCVYKGTEFDDCKRDGKPNGYEGNLCSSFPCKNGGTCKAAADGKSFSCKCPVELGGDTCERELTVSERCAMDNSLIIPHPTECQLYYDCSLMYRYVPYYLEQHLRECTYPQLFSEKTLACENFTDVECGYRQEFKSACNYRHYQCHGHAHCRPCLVDYPSCEGKEDGLWPHGYRTNSPYYMICYKERFVSSGTCSPDPVFNVTSFAHGRDCKSIYEIPKEQNGMQPNCEGKMDGNYGDEHGKCDRYFQCQSGSPKMKLCPDGTMFDLENADCRADAKC